jgi:hypothetical protein
MDLAPKASFRQALHVRWSGLVLASVLASTASAAPSSNPAFLGIGMDPLPPLGCSISNITPDSPAEDAGLRFGDVIVAIEGARIFNGPGSQPCNVLRDAIMAHRPGEVVKLDVRRGSSNVVINASLSTRADILHRRLVGKRLMPTELVDLDNTERSVDLADQRGQTSVVGWFSLEGCVGCGAVFDRVADGIRERLADARPAMFAVTAPSTRGNLQSMRKTFTSTVPIAIAEQTEFDDLALKDTDRVNFMVIDCRGVVRFVAPIAPGAEDIEAAVDEVLAATEQAEHLRTRR